MVQRGRLRDSFLFFTFCVLLGCQDAPLEVYQADAVTLKTKKGITFNQGIPFSGIVIQYFSDSPDTLTVKQFRKGKADGTWKRFYVSGNLNEIRHFANGEKTGDHKYFYPSGQLQFHYQLEGDMYHGFKKEWNPQGSLIAHQNYLNGHEEGPQQLWYNNGKIKSNYIIKNGRRYGLLGTKNCINVKDSSF